MKCESDCCDCKQEKKVKKTKLADLRQEYQLHEGCTVRRKKINVVKYLRKFLPKHGVEACKSVLEFDDMMQYMTADRMSIVDERAMEFFAETHILKRRMELFEMKHVEEIEDIQKDSCFIKCLQPWKVDHQEKTNTEIFEMDSAMFADLIERVCLQPWLVFDWLDSLF